MKTRQRQDQRQSQRQNYRQNYRQDQRQDQRQSQRQNYRQDQKQGQRRGQKQVQRVHYYNLELDYVRSRFKSNAYFVKLRGDSEIIMSTDEKDVKKIISYTKEKRHIAEKITDIVSSIINDNSVIIDATAGVGGDTVVFAERFKLIHAIEINEVRYKLLNEEVSRHDYKNIVTYNEKFDLNFIEDKNIEADAIFFDPPWGGRGAMKVKKLIIGFNGVRIAHFVSDVMKKYKGMRVVFVKLPLNYYERDFQMSFNGAEYEVRMYKFKKMMLYAVVRK